MTDGSTGSQENQDLGFFSKQALHEERAPWPRQVVFNHSRKKQEPVAGTDFVLESSKILLFQLLPSLEDGLTDYRSTGCVVAGGSLV